MRTLLALAAVAGVASASPCPSYTLRQRVLTPAHAKLPPGAGIVIYSATEPDYQPKPAKDPRRVAGGRLGALSPLVTVHVDNSP